MAVRQIETIGEQALLEQAQRGDERAHDRLWRRHGATAWRFGWAITGDSATAAEAVLHGWTSLVAVPREVASAVPVETQVLASVHQAVFTEATVPTNVAGPVAIAFAALAPRRRGVVWLRDVEGLPAVAVAAALGISATAVDPMADRARQQLREQVLAAHATGDRPARCRSIVELLGAYAADELAARPAGRVRRHLDGCAACESILTSLDDITPTLRSLAPAMPLGLRADVHDRWLGALVRPRGPLHLALPGGRAMAPWAERALAGAAAAVVALGISAAVIMAGRGGKSRDDRLAEQAAADEPLGAADGESALGGGEGLDGVLDVTSLRPTDLGALPTAPPSPAPAPPAAPPSAPSRATVTPGTLTPPTTDTPSTPPPGPAPAPEPTPPPTSEPALEVTVGVPGVVTVVVGDECTGVDLLGTTIGCEPDSEGPLDLGGSTGDQLDTTLGGLGL